MTTEHNNVCQQLVRAECSYFAPRGVRALPLGVAVKRSVHYICDYFGPSGVRALPLGVAAKRSVHYICDYFGPSVLRAPAAN